MDKVNYGENECTCIRRQRNSCVLYGVQILALEIDLKNKLINTINDGFYYFLSFNKSQASFLTA